jgi:hypothetical protein
VSPPVSAFREGVWIGKPTTTPGNSIPAYEDDGYTLIGEEMLAPKMDAPMLKFFIDCEGNWTVIGEDYAGTRGPADFVNLWRTPEEAIDDILDFYFGNPTRMEKKAACLEALRRRTASQ